MGFLDSLAQSFVPAYQQSGQNYLDRQLQEEQLRRQAENDAIRNQLIEQQMAGLQQDRQFAVEDRDAAAKAAEQEQAKLLGQLGQEAGGLTKTMNLLDTLSASGKVSPDQKAAIETLPIQERGAALMELTGALSPAPSANDQAKLAQIQADIALKNAQAEKAGRIETPKETTLLQNLRAAGIDPASPEGQKIITDSLTKPATQIDLGDKVDQVVKTEQAKAGIKRGGEISEQMDSIDRSDQAVARMQGLSEKAATGLGGYDPLFKGAQIIESMGIDLPGIDVPASEEFRANANKLVLDSADALTGVLSDRDMQTLRDTGPDLMQTREGRNKILDGIVKGNAIKRSRLETEAQLLADNPTMSAVAAKKTAREHHPAPDALFASGSAKSGDEPSTPITKAPADMSDDELLKALGG